MLNNNSDDKSTPFISILILKSCETDDCKLCIESINKFNKPNTYEIIIANNISNEFLNICKGESILCISSKVIATPNLLFNLYEALTSSESIALVSPLLNYTYKADNLYTKPISDKLDFSQIYNVSDSNLWTKYYEYNEYCFMIKKSIFLNIPLSNENFSKAILHSNYEILLCEDTLVYSYENIIYKFKDILPRDALSLESNPSNMVNLIKYNNNTINLLYIGSNAIEIIVNLKKIYKEANIFGIEVNSTAPPCELRNFKRGNINEINFDYDNNFFDYIILDYCVEKTIYPHNFIININTFLKTNGYIINYLYNICSIDCISKIINDKFNYSENNILSKENIRFFTPQESCKLYINTNLEISNVMIVYNNSTEKNSILLDNYKSILNPDLKSVHVSNEFCIVAHKLSDSISEVNIRLKKQLDYIDYLFDKNSNEYEDLLIKGYEYDKKDTKILAYYLPQFHFDKVNEDSYGRCTTEWDTVTRALPLYTGHYQPILPMDLGFYNLEMKSSLKKQIELARNSGIYGFVIYYYSHNYNAVLRKPVEILLQNKDLDIPFCFCWANENWTKGYQSSSKEIKLEQSKTFEYYVDVIKDICKYMKDDRYITINNKKLIVIYRPFNVPRPKEVFSIWRQYCQNNNIGDIYIMGILQFTNPNVEEYYDLGFDGVSEFMPHSNIYDFNDINSQVDFIKKKNSGFTFDYKDYVINRKYYKNAFEKLYKCVTPSWDNSPRKLSEGWIFKDSSPSLYYKWLLDIMKSNKINDKLDDDIVFVNAWNEWSEGAILEPCSKLGYANLNKTKEALEECRKFNSH